MGKFCSGIHIASVLSTRAPSNAACPRTLSGVLRRTPVLATARRVTPAAPKPTRKNSTLVARYDGNRRQTVRGGAARRVGPKFQLSVDLDAPSLAHRSSRDGSSGFWGGFVTGGIVLGALGYVFAPQVSKEGCIEERGAGCSLQGGRLVPSGSHQLPSMPCVADLKGTAGRGSEAEAAAILGGSAY